MKLTYFLIIASVFTAKTCRPEVVLATKSSDKSTSNLVKDLVKIVTSCYGDRLHTVGLAGNLPEALSRTLATEHSIPVVLINDARNCSSDTFSEKFRHKIHVFIIEASTSQQLDVIIEMNIRCSIWWDHMASFFIVDRSPGCVNAKNYLLVAWKRNAINAKVLCYGSKSARTVYNYNPFTHQAPVPWKQYAVTRGIIDHPFTLFYRKYRENESICLNLDFHKSNDLGGYEIRVGKVHPRQYKLNRRRKLVDRYYLIAVRVQNIVFRALNGTIIFSKESKNDLYSLNNDNDILCIFFPTVANGTKFFTYPHTYIGTSLISQSRGYKTQHNKMFSVIDTHSWICLAIVYLLTLFLFKFLIRQAIIPALLNIIRITCNTGFTNLPDDTASRIYVSCLLFFTIVMQVIIQSDLATLLTVRVPLQNVDTLEDVHSFDYKICGPYIWDEYNKNPDLKGRIIRASTEDCFQYAKNDSSVAYYGILNHLDLDEVLALKMHVSRRLLEVLGFGFPIRQNWALEQPVNSIITKLVEADACESWNSRHQQLTDFKFGQVTDSSDYRQLEFGDLSFAFVFLGIGLACATISFIFETVIGYKCICRFERRQ